ncbi:MAG: exodeoxyribonuclease VII large subunit [Rhodothermia bacterium]|nr:exodeoxyribonuclease VII large subunit [Rhodothermia bacterium]
MSEHDSNQPLTVSELVGKIRAVLQEGMGLVRVAGEVSNMSRPTSGHCYFTLKDESSQIRCVLFRSDFQRLRFAPQDGMQVVVTGHTDVYHARGSLQIRARSMVAAGEGALQKAFEQLKRKLQKEGLFDVERKQLIPRFPTRIALVTSGTGAAIRDLLHILERRFPLAEVLLCPVQVQGMSAANEIASTVRELNRLNHRPGIGAIDVMIVGRGGGSVEDLWAFNEEIVARAIFESAIPVVSAVGHETDVTIADFVADVRAPTPSAAAELVVPDRRELERQIHLLARKARGAVAGLIARRRQRVNYLVRSHGMMRPQERIEQLYLQIDDLNGRMSLAATNALRRRMDKVLAIIKQLEALSPERTLERGYVRVERAGKPVTRASDLKQDDTIDVRFHDGDQKARIL